MKRHTVPAGSVVVFAIAVGLVGSLSASGQTLGEVAKKEADRRKAQPSAGKVYTNKDLPSSAQKPATTATPAGETPAPADPVAAATEQKAEDAKASGEKPQGDQKDEAYWKNRMSTAREELRRNEMFAEALQTRINSLNQDFTSRDNPAQRSAIGTDRTEALKELDARQAGRRARQEADRRHRRRSAQSQRASRLASLNSRPRGFSSRPDSPRRRQGLATDDAPACAGASGPCGPRGARSAGSRAASRSSGSPSVVLSDLRLPDGDGFGVLRAVEGHRCPMFR